MKERINSFKLEINGVSMNIVERVTGKTKVLGVIGNPIEHSISPQLHNTVSHMLEMDFIYVPFRIDRENLGDAVKGLRALGFEGFNVTVPYKKDVLQFLDEVTKEVQLIGAANTIKNLDGRLYGYNTDAEGFARSFKEESGTSFEGKHVTILGAGGAARAIAVKVALEGASSIRIINRTLEKAVEIAEIINQQIGPVAQGYHSDAPRIFTIIDESDIIVNTTSIGMYPEVEGCPVDEGICFKSHQIVYDAVYNPTKTKLLKKAEQNGCKTINGLGMLFYQGIYAYEIWTGIKLKKETIKDAYASFLTILKI